MGGWASKPPAAGCRGAGRPRGTGAEEKKAPVHGFCEARCTYRFDRPGDPGAAAEREPPQVPRCEVMELCENYTKPAPASRGRIAGFRKTFVKPLAASRDDEPAGTKSRLVQCPHAGSALRDRPLVVPRDRSAAGARCSGP